MKCFKLNLLFLAAIGLIIVSCAPYEIIKSLEKPIPYSSTCAIGTIADQLPEMDPEKKPTLEDIVAFKGHIFNALNKYKCMEILELNDDEAGYEVNGGIVKYARGSGTLRFFFGSMAGTARLEVNLQLVDKKSNEVLFGGRYWAEVGGGDWMTSGSTMFERVAVNFAKSLQKQAKKQAKKSDENYSTE